MQVSLVVPTLNAGEGWKEFISVLSVQSFQPDIILVVDSGSVDGTDLLAEKAGYQVHRIEGKAFNHGGTRQLAVDLLPESDLFVFLTQDAVFKSPDALQVIVNFFEIEGSSRLGAACGRQLPHLNAEPIAAHSRFYNYGDESKYFSKEDISSFGLKATFMSDSFSAYRASILREVGGFEKGTIVCEDALLAGRMLLAGYMTAYVAEATVYHSHNFNLMEEAQRYFDIGVAHARQPWFIESFGEPEGEGVRFIRSEFVYLIKNRVWQIPSALVRNSLKYLFYRLGRKECWLPVVLKKHLSYQKYFWL